MKNTVLFNSFLLLFLMACKHPQKQESLNPLLPKAVEVKG